jgi:hypothetical protein
MKVIRTIETLTDEQILALDKTIVVYNELEAILDKDGRLLSLEQLRAKFTDDELETLEDVAWEMWRRSLFLCYLSRNVWPQKSGDVVIPMCPADHFVHNSLRYIQGEVLEFAREGRASKMQYDEETDTVSWVATIRTADEEATASAGENQ